MTEEQIKEQLSRNFVQLVAGRSGFKCKESSLDHGVDLTIAEVRSSTRNGRTRLIESGRYVDLQLKSTCDASLHPGTVDSFKYDLESKTYNDLVERWATPPATPLYLVLLVLPDDSGDWLNISDQELVLRRSAYWYRPAPASTMTTNSSSIRIEIPLTNAIRLSFVADRYAEFYV